MTGSNKSGPELAYGLIIEKRDQLLTERADIRQQRASLAARDRAIDRDLADCVAAARVFGYSLELPSDDSDGEQIALFPGVISASGVGKTWALMRSVQNAIAAVDRSKAAVEAVGDEKVISAAAPAMPKIRDIVLDRLQAAGDQGTKALPIRKYIEDTYHQDIHEKTVGMTLYRLSQEGLAHRNGHIWFFGPEQSGTENPGVAAPGSDNRAT
jgi:hypothetical protein